MRDLFLDADGVLADFDQGFYILTGIYPDEVDDDVMWRLLDDQPDFYFILPVMADAHELVSYCEPYRPRVLTGLPSGAKQPLAAQNKKAWFAKNFPGLPVTCCMSKDKAQYCTPGAVIVDDTPKYAEKWVDAGGVWIPHISAKTSIALLKEINFGQQ